MTAEHFAIVGASAVAGRDLRLVESAVVVVDNGVIVSVGPPPDVAVPEGAAQIDASGLTLIPGFVDAHVHIGFAEPADVLRGGVTTVRDLAWPLARIWPLARASKRTGFDGPLILAAGQMLTVEGGYPMHAAWAPPGTGRVVRGPEDAERAVSEQADEGAAIVKVALHSQAGPTLDETLLRAVIACAHERDLRVTAHISGLAELEKAVAAGVDELAHMLIGADRIPDDLVAEMAERGIVVVPTLSIFFGAEQETAVDNLRRFREAGGHVVYGTDLGNDGPGPGIDSREVRALGGAEMTGRAILASATVDSAVWLALEGTGSLDPGMAADIVAVEGHPLVDPHALTRVRMVWRAGRRAR